MKESRKNTSETCRLKGCDRPIYIKKHRLCLPHYQRYARTGDPGGKIIRKYKLLPAFEARKNT